MEYVILAAGQGSRFVRQGLATPKPMVEILGKPMIGRLIDQLMENGATRINIVANADMPTLLEYLGKLKGEGYPLDVRAIRSDNSYWSLSQAAEGLSGKFVALTVDAILPGKEFTRYVKEVDAMPEGSVLMGLTRFCDDESPLYAKLDVNGEVCDYRYGGEPFDNTVIVSAGVYGLTADAMKHVAAECRAPESLSDFQKILAAETPIHVKVFEFEKAMDVDNLHDRSVAENFLVENNGEKRAPETWFSKIKKEYESTLKSSDTEEHVDLYFYRPLGYAWARFFRAIHVSPNVVTILSIFLGIAAALCFYHTSFWLNLLGVGFLVWANTYDSADGQLARLTKQYSQIGRVLDGMAGDIWFIGIYIALCLRCGYSEPFFMENTSLIWILAVVAGISHLSQAAMADYYRQFHLFLLHGGVNKELVSSAQIRERYASLSWGRNFFGKLMAWLYLEYTIVQEHIAPEAVAVRRRVAELYPDGIPGYLTQELRAMSAPLCKYENFLTFNWRSFFLFGSVLAGLPWFYFLAEITLFNIVLVYLNRRHEAMCRRMEGLL